MVQDNHFIPEFYLHQWTNAESGQLCELSRPYDRVKSKRRYPSGTGFETGLYDLPALGEHAGWLEDRFFRRVDQDAFHAHQLLLNGETEMSLELRTAWTRFLMSLINRAPHRLEVIKNEYAKKAATLNFDAVIQENAAAMQLPNETLRGLIDRMLDVHLGELIKETMDDPEIGSHINQMRWEVYESGNLRRNFLTCDYPVVISRGLQLEDTYISIPVSPRKLFLAANPKCRIEKLWEVAQSDVVRAANFEIVKQARKYVYATDELQINYVEKHLRKEV